MEMQLFTLSDFAQNIGGKITIVGTFDTIYSPQIPAIHPACSVAARLFFDKKEEGKHSFKLSILDDHNKNVVPDFEGELDVKIADDRTWGTANIVVSIGGMQFASYGNYSLNLWIDNKQVKTLPFEVKKTIQKK